ncbi:MAG: response regulator [Armatimonadetes bacterium]|nr:response regulator [Armatimonadota bacterium]
MTPDPDSRRKARRRVLVVEDEPPVMQFLDALLTQSGYEVLQARNGVEAMVALTAPRRDLPHAILLDLGLPLEDGISVLNFLRNVMRSGIPVIVVTGRHEPEEEAAVRELGITALLRKPPNSQQILSALSVALD